jgi:hypothetical protein
VTGLIGLAGRLKGSERAESRIPVESGLSKKVDIYVVY